MWENIRNFLAEAVNLYSLFILLYSLLVLGAYWVLLIASTKRLREFVRLVRTDMTGFSYYTKPVSLLVPAFNETNTVVDSVRSMLKLDYPEFEIIVVNDGSTDSTLAHLQEAFRLQPVKADFDEKLPTAEIRGAYRSADHPQLLVVDKENGGKSDALNTGINFSRYPLFCAVDADCVVERDALFRIVNPYLKYENVIAVGGMVRIANGSEIEEGRVVRQKAPQKWIERFQTIEYLRAFIISRIGFQWLNSVMIISGAFGLFEKAVVVGAGGYKKTIGEDMELVLRIQEYMIEQGRAYKIDFASDAVCWTQAPGHYKDLAGQRVRWQCGLIDSLWKHRKMFLNPRFKRIGLFSMPFYFVIELLGPLLEMVGYVLFVLAWLSGSLGTFALYIFLIAYFSGLLFSLVALMYDEWAYHRYTRLRDVLILLASTFLEASYTKGG